MEDYQAQLIAEQLKHAIHLLQSDLEALRAQQAHDREMTQLRLTSLETTTQDHESRLRSTTDGVTQFKMWTGLASGGSSLAALAALLRSFLSGAP